MTRRRRIVVAFEEVESAASRVVGHLSSPTFADGDLSGPPSGRGRYWCAADKPDVGDEHFRLASVYRTQTVPDRALRDVRDPHPRPASRAVLTHRAPARTGACITHTTKETTTMNATTIDTSAGTDVIA
ncbi:MAG TPA: hypothetical protein VGO80_06295 [Solirubrobacteraceae bacterium]|nr:hypothetical protein [Solirubrobacteraceae bacterium]